MPLFRRVFMLLVLVVVELSSHQVARAQTAIPFVVQDLFVLPNATQGNYQPGAVVSYNGYAYFAATSTTTGRELWRTDGTALGTTLVCDIYPGLGSSSPADFVVSGGFLYFTADDGTHGREVWRTDGTAWGTRIAADVNPGAISSSPQNLVSAGGKLFFSASPGFNDYGMGYALDGGTLTALRPVGSCCLQSGSCIQTSSLVCGGQVGSMWGGIGRACSSTPCNAAVSVACCMPDKSCVYTDSATCTAAGGSPRAPNTACASCGDPAIFTCCTGTTCSVGPLSSCAGTEIQLITSCSPDPCAQAAQACCLPSGQCFMVRFATDCSSRSGTLLSPGQTCINSDFPLSCVQPTYACCRLTGACVLVTPTNCRNSRGFILPGGVSCSPGLCFVANTTDLSPSSGQAAPAGSRAVIFAQSDSGPQMWSSDGTVAGSARLSGGPAGYLAGGGFPFGMGGQVFFVSDSSSSPPRALWATDGTSAGTRLVPGLASGAVGGPSGSVCASGGYLYFPCADASGVMQLCRTDGTAAGTAYLTSYANPQGQPQDLSPLSGGVVFSALAADSRRHWYFASGTPGSIQAVGPSGTALYAPTSPGHIGVGGLVFLAASTSTSGSDLWVTNGASAGTQLVSGAITPTNFGSHGGKAYFMATDNQDPAQPKVNVLWASDGTPAGTGVVSLIAGELDINLTELAAGNGTDLFFAAQDAAVGVELFKTSGTLGSTMLVKDIRAGALSSSPSKLTFNNGLLLFNATGQSTQQLYRSDGTSSGTFLIGGGPMGFVSANAIAKAGNLFYYQPTNSEYLYRTDGTLAGTYALDLFASTGSDHFTLSSAADLNGALYFTGYHPNVGAEFWRSDGTVAGTQIVADLFPGSQSSAVAGYTRIGMNIFFNARTDSQGLQPWISDGTAAGTHRAAVISSGGSDSYAANYTDLHGLAIFSANNYTVGTVGIGEEVFRSDGTAAGTFLLRDILPGINTSVPRNFVAAGNLVFFSADDGVHGRELWRTDGTVAGTMMVRDICIGDIGSQPANITAAGDRVYFTAYTPENGVELWTSDGTPDGTFMLFDLVPGPGSANIRSLTIAGSRLYFLATVFPQRAALYSFDWSGGLAAGFICAADYNRSGASNVQDIFDFLAEWFEGASRADFDGDGHVNVPDIFAFLSRWFTGC